ncbi:MAG: flagellar hook-basal body complex protein FliE [Nannocystaceae bacterium]|nr:flagellar hook-basal body complex protein FliE [bacterium]
MTTISKHLPISRTQSVPREESTDDKGFGDVLADGLEKARDAETQANDLGERFAAGDPTVGIHEMMISAERAGISLRYAVTLKNKAIEAYRDLMNTPL